MIVFSFVLAAALQQQTPQAEPLDARIVVRPANAEIAVGDSVRLTADVRDPAGNAISNARVVFRAAGGSFEGTVDSTGLVVGGATGDDPGHRRRGRRREAARTGAGRGARGARTGGAREHRQRAAPPGGRADDRPPRALVFGVRRPA